MPSLRMSSSRPADCVAGNEALRRGAWPEARDAFTAALRVRESPEALEGLGLAAWWLDAADVVFDTRERAYRLYLERSERPDTRSKSSWRKRWRGESRSPASHGTPFIR